MLPIVQLTLRWGDRPLRTKRATLVAGFPLRVGDDPDFAVPDDQLDGASIELLQPAARGVRLSAPDGSKHLLGAGAWSRIELGAVALDVAVEDGATDRCLRRPAIAPFWPQGLSLLLHAAVVAVLAVLPGHGGGAEQAHELRTYLTEVLTDSARPADLATDSGGGDEASAGASPDGPSGSARDLHGTRRAVGSRARPVVGPDDARAAVESFGLLSWLARSFPNEPGRAVWGHEASSGGDPGMWTEGMGGFGTGGLGLSGMSAGGDDSSDTIGISDIGGPSGSSGGNSSSGGSFGSGGLGGFGRSAPPAFGGGHRFGSLRICGGTDCTASVNGRLPPEVIQRIVRQNFGRFRFCYEQGLERQPSLEGRVAVKFVIDRSGAVSLTQDGGSDLPDSGVVACVVRAFGALSFPQPEGGLVTVVYPLVFTPQ
jgi:hypothetical protein